jgi:hypothetical protein
VSNATVSPFHTTPSCRHWATLNFQRFGVNETIRNLPVGNADDIAECLSGNIHLFCGVFLVQTFKIGQTHRFKFVYSQGNFL